MAHTLVPAAEEILDKEFPVLDHGFVRLVDYLGSDQRIVQSARVSYGAGTKTVRRDRGLIRYLLRNEHTSPFEQVVFTFHAKLPIFVARQWIRHRTARLNEISGRYSILSDEFYVPAADQIALQSTDNKQGRSADPVEPAVAEEVREYLGQGQKRAYKEYEELLDKGIARELARVNLPVSVYTEWYWQIDLHNLFRFLRLRLDAHAQAEIRAYASVMRDLAEKVCPIAFEAFDDYVLGGESMSRMEIDALRRLARHGEGGEIPPGDDPNREITKAGEEAGLSEKEIQQLITKLGL